MFKLPVVNLREAENPKLIQSIRNASSSEFQSRIPDPTQATMEQTLETLHKYPGLRNEFDHNLINLIGSQIFRSNSWHNPLAVFKKGNLPFGATVEEIQTDLLTAKVHDWEADSLEKDVFGQERLPTATSFHTVNRENKYKVSQNEAALRRAFLTEKGLGNYIHGVVGALETSNNHDEFLIMSNLLVENFKNDGYFMINTPAVVDKNTAEDLLIKIRENVENVRFLETMYNAAGMHTAAEPDELVIITSPAVKARIDVQALAAAFNIAYADVPTRIVTIPQKYWDIEGAQAILTTEDFFQVWDTLTQATSIMNPDGLYTTNWLHSHGIFSMSRFVPAILFTSEPVTEQVNVKITVSSVTDPEVYGPDGNKITAKTAARGEYVQIISQAKTNREGVGEAVRFEIVSDTFSQITMVNNEGVLLTGVDETALTVKVDVISVVDSTKRKTVEITLTGDVVELGFKRRIEEAPKPPTEG